MPSGSKKRKAAKKKKLNIPHGVDDLKHQEAKESNISELDSPTSQDHYSPHDPSTKGNEEEFEAGENITNFPSTKELKIQVGDESSIVVEKENVTRVDKDLTIENKSKKKDEIFEHDDTKGGSSIGSSSSSNSSDDESHSIKSSQAVADISLVLAPVKVADSLSACPFEAINTASTEEASEPKECNDLEKHHELLLARVPHAVQTSSWKSCCGLFEVFSGSVK